jgi:hypothetical protein
VRSRLLAKFYGEFLGLRVVQTSQISLMVRLGGKHCIVVVYTKRPSGMRLLSHNGLDVETKDEVDTAHKIGLAEAAKSKLHKITKPVLQHGTYSFYFWDADENCWEISANPYSGYDRLFEAGDQTSYRELRPV